MLAKLFLYYNSLNKLTKLHYFAMQSFRLMCIVQFKKMQITYLRPATFCKSRDDVRNDVRGLLIILYRIVDIMISVTKQMEAAEANVCCGGLQNDN